MSRVNVMRAKKNLHFNGKFLARFFAGRDTSNGPALLRFFYVCARLDSTNMRVVRNFGERGAPTNISNGENLNL